MKLFPSILLSRVLTFNIHNQQLAWHLCPFVWPVRQDTYSPLIGQLEQSCSKLGNHYLCMVSCFEFQLFFYCMWSIYQLDLSKQCDHFDNHCSQIYYYLGSHHLLLLFKDEYSRIGMKRPVIHALQCMVQFLTVSECVCKCMVFSYLWKNKLFYGGKELNPNYVSFVARHFSEKQNGSFTLVLKRKRLTVTPFGKHCGVLMYFA